MSEETEAADRIEWLKSGLQDPGKTQAGLAKALGIDPSGVSRLLSGERRLLASEITKAAGYFGTAVNGLRPAELELLNLLRGNETSDPFTVEISFSDGRWSAEKQLSGLEDEQGAGETFEEAWQSRKQSPSGRLKAMRRKSGFASAIEAVEKYGWNENTYRSHENGHRDFGRDDAIVYAKAFGVKAGWLMFGDEH
jgi:transcriptional regulator with XRE-family HTH domain